jgi:hypothetical protein
LPELAVRVDFLPHLAVAAAKTLNPNKNFSYLKFIMQMMNIINKKVFVFIFILYLYLIYGQASCQVICQASCQVTCQLTCQASCQVTCQLTCQVSR